jgi:AraC family transcriptional regulator, ethanolamine operon transcriptional activator
MNHLINSANVASACAPLSVLQNSNGAEQALQRTYSVRNVTAQDADEHAHNLSHWQQLYDQLAAGPFAGQLSELWLEDAQVFCEYTSHTVRQSCVVWPDSYWFGIPYGDGNHGRIDGRYVGDDAIALRPGSCEFELLTPNRFNILGVVINEQALLRHALEVEHVDLQASLQSREILPVGTAAKRRFANFILNTLGAVQRNGAVQASPNAQRELQQAILSGLVSLLGVIGGEPKTSTAHRNRQRLVNRVRDHVLARHEHAVTVPDLCRQFHVSRRTLHNSFCQVLGVSPAAYLRSIRLNSVRRELKNPVSPYHSVQDVAAAWGFWHLSQFASDYKHLFGELPSAALRARSAVSAWPLLK